MSDDTWMQWSPHRHTHYTQTHRTHTLTHTCTLVRSWVCIYSTFLHPHRIIPTFPHIQRTTSPTPNTNPLKCNINLRVCAHQAHVAVMLSYYNPLTLQTQSQISHTCIIMPQKCYKLTPEPNASASHWLPLYLPCRCHCNSFIFLVFICVDEGKQAK